MPQLQPSDIIPLLQTMQTALRFNLFSQEEVINWAESIVEKEKEPHIFFIDLLLSSSRSKNDILQYMSESVGYIKFQGNARPLFSLTYQKLTNKELSLKQTIGILHELIHETDLSGMESSDIYHLQHLHELAEDNIQGSIQDVENETLSFLKRYNEYSIYNTLQWSILDKQIVELLEQECLQLRIQSDIIDRELKKQKKWWKFW